MKKIEVLGPFGIKLRLVRARPTGSVFIYLFIYLFVPGFYRYRLLQPILKFWPQVEGGCPLKRFWIQPPRSTPWGTSPWVLFFGYFQYNLYEGPTHCRTTIKVVGMGHGGGQTQPSTHIWIRIEKTFPTVYGSMGYGGGFGGPTSPKSGNSNGKVV